MAQKKPVARSSRTNTTKTVVSKSSGKIVNAKRSRASRKAAATRKLNEVLRIQQRSALRLHHKILGIGGIAAVLVFTAFGIHGQLQAYASTSSSNVFSWYGNKCLDNAGSRLQNGNKVQIYKCNGTGAQQWVLTSVGELRANNGTSNYCIDVPGNSKQESANLQLYKCNGTGAQKWKLSDKSIVSQTTGFCITVRNATVGNGIRLWMKKCRGSIAQKWNYSTATTPTPTGNTPSTGTSSGSTGGTSTGGSTGSGSTGSSSGNTGTSSGSTGSTGSSSGSTGTTTGHFTKAFGSFASTSTPINCNGQSNVTISGHTFRSIGNDKPSITISNCTNVTITDNDFIDDAEPIYVVNSHNITISYNRYQNITGPHTRNGSNRGNFTQWVNSYGGSINNNKGIGGDTEDIVSIYKSGGESASSPLIIENNAFQGTNWSSGSGSGMMLGDGGGSHIIARNNTLVNPGQVGIGVCGGSDIHVTGNKIYGEKRTSSNVGVYVANYSGGTMSGIEVANNQVNWKNAAGTANGGWNSGDAGTVAGWSSNNFNASLTLASLAVSL